MILLLFEERRLSEFALNEAARSRCGERLVLFSAEGVCYLDLGVCCVGNDEVRKAGKQLVL